jgi:hypothetical protein
MTNYDPLLDNYLARGWALVPVPSDQKRPAIKGWPDRTFGEKDFSPDLNIGARVGERSGNLTDMDLDCEEAVELSELYLPKTPARFGRPSRPASHRLYIAAGARFEVFGDPISGEVLIELRSDGRDGGAHLTLLPPSIADGERRRWEGEGVDPAVVDARVLRLCAARLAIGALTLRYVSEHAARRPGPDLPRVLWEFDHELGRTAYKWLRQPAPDESQCGQKPRSERTEREIALDELARIIPNDMNWADWNRAGMAFFAASSGSNDGYIAFDDFSAKSAKYDPEVVKERWRNFRRSPPSRIGMGTLIHLARQAGWNPAARAS